ncbi:hypothetical protein [Marinospirillum sp.]|uniref:hypothetical protein n=1 Tax=Marinospirillum sp. TaxID=2183934 RepID=UPI00384C802B
MYKQLLLLVLFITLVGCGGGKPNESDLEKSFNESFDGFKQAGIDLSQYIEASSFDISDSYEDGRFYVVTATPKINIKKSLDNAAIQSIDEQAGELSSYIFVTIKMLEELSKYDAGQINQQEMMANLQTAHLEKPEGILKAGTTFYGLESEYKFRKTDNGWMAVE